mmetsp:Transcript_4346/g.15296  ORF Transcript_4346/g.15296 Transcript_4346/m.15296 type:complete len:262 (+) Transcript_4346:1877-2662(+)
MGVFTPSSKVTITVPSGSAPSPSTTTVGASAWFTTLSPSTGSVMVTPVGGVVSWMTGVVTGTPALPASSVSWAETTTGPSSKIEISVSGVNHVPSGLTVAGTVIGGLLLSSKVTVTVEPGSAPVPETTTWSSSASLTKLSPSMGVLMPRPFGAVLSCSALSVAGLPGLPAVSVSTAVTVTVPSSRPEMSIPLAVKLPSPLFVAVAGTGVLVPSLMVTTIVDEGSLTEPPVMVTELSSVSLMMSSPSMGVSIVRPTGPLVSC